MPFWDRFRLGTSASLAVPARTSGLPTSSNGASSMHVQWLNVPDDVLAVSVDLTVIEPPASSHLHFWALQASFMDGTETRGAGHLGLQWISGYPGQTAVNWGGYHQGGGELEGSSSTLPSARDNVNTRDFSWSSGRSYRLRISPGATGWLGSVTDLATETTVEVRELLCPGARLGNIVMWSEVFAPCEGPSSSVRWSSPSVETPSGPQDVSNVKLSYQSVGGGGCSNTNSATVPGQKAVEQTTAVQRTNQHGSTLQL